jgi:aspartate/methionine/tyrosine aminotransferase
LLTPEEGEQVLAAKLGYGWTDGAVELREAIAALYPGRGPDHIIVTNGLAEANFIMAMTLVEPGDEIVVVVPNYLQIKDWTKALGAIVREVPLHEELGWLPDLADLKAAIAPRTKFITVCTPNNPTGKMLPRAMIEELVTFARQHDLWLHSDAVYKGCGYGAPESPTVGDLYENAIVTDGLSKAMAMPGLRIGRLVGPASEIHGTRQRKDYTSIITSTVSEIAARITLKPERRKAILARIRVMLSRNVAQNRACWPRRATSMAWTAISASASAARPITLPLGWNGCPPSCAHCADEGTSITDRPLQQ